MINARKRIFLSPPDIHGDEIKSVQEAFESNYIAPTGPMVKLFADRFIEYTGITNALPVNSGTSAMHLALRAAGVGKKNIVLASTLTFIGSVSPIKYLNSDVYFIDSDRNTWNMDPDLLVRGIELAKRNGETVQAVVPTDLYGECCDYEALNEICESFGAKLIVDCAESLGSLYKGKHSGSTGFASVFSFNGNKIITASSGGMLASNDENVVNISRYLSQQAKGDVPFYLHDDIGYNYSLSNICAAIGVGQFKHIQERVSKKRLINDWYKQALSEISSIDFLLDSPGCISNKWLTVIIMNNLKKSPEELRRKLEGYNIESRRVWNPMHLQPVFKDNRCIGGSVAEELFDRGLCLPSGTSLTSGDIDMIADIIINYMNS